MKKFLTRFFLLIPVLLVVWIVGIYVMGMFPAKYRKNLQYFPSRGFAQRKMREADTVKNVDVLVLGSSHAYRGFDPRIFKKYGLNLFNLGTSSQTPIETKYMVDKYIDKLKPKYVIFEVYYTTFEIDGLESSLDIIYSANKVDQPMVEMVSSIKKIKAYNALVYSWLRKDLFQMNEKEFPKGLKKEATDYYVSGGYVGSTVDHEVKVSKKSSKKKVEFLPENQRIFEQIIDELKKRNIKVILVQAPTYPSRYKGITNKSDINSYFSSIGIPYYNYNDINPLSEQFFLDDSHLNQKGVDIFNALLIKKLIKDNVLTVKSN